MLYVCEVIGCETLKYFNPLSCTLATEKQELRLFIWHTYESIKFHNATIHKYIKLLEVSKV